MTEWISVKERLPENEVRVLCCTETKNGTLNTVLGYYCDDLKRWCSGMNSNVAYWMPLPELPKKEYVKKMKGLVLYDDGRIEAEELDSLKGMQKIVGGYIEAVSNTMLGAPYLLIVNEEGKLQDLPSNINADMLSLYDPICGNAIVLKEGIVDGEPDIVGLSDKEIENVFYIVTGGN